MARNYSKNNKCCATCTYWAGSRKLNSGNISLVALSSSGPCVVERGPWSRKDCKADRHCNKWEVWSALKK